MRISDWSSDVCSSDLTMTRLLLLLSVWLLAVAATPFDPFAKARIDEHSGAQIPLSGAFTDQQGGKVTLAELGGGKPIFLVPVLHADRKSVVKGTSVSVRLDHGGSRIIKKKKKK